MPRAIARVGGPRRAAHAVFPETVAQGVPQWLTLRSRRCGVPLRRPAAAASRRKLPGAAARHPTNHPEAHFRTPAYLPDRPDRLAPCRGHAPDVTLHRPYVRYASPGSRT